jgi:RimJ/RimL family protein N-acetyltransferase
MDVRVREARPDDAERLLAFVREMAHDPEALVPLVPDEPPCSFTVDEERCVIVDYAAADNAVFLVAEVDGEIVGELNCRGGIRSSLRHAALLGVSVRAGWRDRGVGSALLAAALDWARATGVVTRIELSVYAENARAIHLYEKFGFAIEGRRRDAVRHSGRLVDDLVMARLL